ncbi:MAG: prephenate dehydratase, partial [Methanoregula sp.]
VFATRRINLTRIESRPSKKGMGKYVFFLDYAVNTYTDEALRELREITNIRNLGCYPRIEVPL